MKSFDEIYEKIHSKKNEELENIKQFNKKVDKKRTKAKIFSIISWMILMPGLAYISLDSGSYNEMLFATGSIILGVIIVVPYFIVLKTTYKLEYLRLFKEYVIKELVKNMDNDITYDELHTAKERDYLYNQYKRGEFEKYNEYYAEDFIWGMLDRKYQLRMAEVHTEIKKEDSSGNKIKKTLFHGIFCNVESAKNINTTLKIHSDKGILGNIFKGKTKIEMDSTEFEKHFDINAENKIIAMQILTSDVMQMMIEFREQSKIKYELTIKENQIYIRFHTEELFEPKKFTHSLDYNMLKQYYDIIEFVIKVSREINKVIENTEI